MKAQRLVVTGGGGFIGSHIVDQLCDAGHSVCVVDNFSTGKARNLDRARILQKNLSIIDVSITDRAARGMISSFKPNCILHLAAQFSVAVSMSDPLLDAQTNVSGLVGVLEAARESGCKKIVFASSGGTIYGDVERSEFATSELTSRRPKSFYGLSKSVAIDYLDLYKEHFGLDFVALALGNVYGPRQDPYGEAGVVAIFARKILSGEVCLIHGNGLATRDFVHVKDVANAFLLAINAGTGLINIASSREISVLEVRDTVSRVAGIPVQSRHIGALDGQAVRVCLQIDRAKNQLGWSPSIQFEEGVSTVVEWLKSEMEAGR